MNELVRISDGQVRATSQDVAAAFEKAHKDVLRAIDKMIELAPEISRRNFAPRESIVRGRPYRGYEMDRDGFSLLAMGFTGPKALQWKVKFLEAFKKLEEALSRSVAANDMDGELPASQQGGINAKTRQVELMLKAAGAAPAIQLWKDLGLPMSPRLEALININLPHIERAERAGALPSQEVGPLYQWVEECRVRQNPAVAHPSHTLWQEYASWCGRRGYRFMEPPQFVQGLRNMFGPAQRKGIFNLDIGKTSIGVSGE
jgi:Rha family phage regulatory protein